MITPEIIKTLGLTIGNVTKSGTVFIWKQKDGENFTTISEVDRWGEPMKEGDCRFYKRRGKFWASTTSPIYMLNDAAFLEHVEMTLDRQLDYEENKIDLS